MAEDPLATLEGSGSGSAHVSTGEVNLSSVCEDENTQQDFDEDKTERVSLLSTSSMSSDEYQLMLALRRELDGDEAAEVDPWNPRDKHRPHPIPPSSRPAKVVDHVLLVHRMIKNLPSGWPFSPFITETFQDSEDTDKYSRPYRNCIAFHNRITINLENRGEIKGLCILYTRKQPSNYEHTKDMHALEPARKIIDNDEGIDFFRGFRKPDEPVVWEYSATARLENTTFDRVEVSVPKRIETKMGIEYEVEPTWDDVVQALQAEVQRREATWVWPPSQTIEREEGSIEVDKGLVLQPYERAVWQRISMNITGQRGRRPGSSRSPGRSGLPTHPARHPVPSSARSASIPPPHQNLVPPSARLTSPSHPNPSLISSYYRTRLLSDSLPPISDFRQPTADHGKSAPVPGTLTSVEARSTKKRTRMSSTNGGDINPRPRARARKSSARKSSDSKSQNITSYSQRNPYPYGKEPAQMSQMENEGGSLARTIAGATQAYSSGKLLPHMPRQTFAYGKKPLYQSPYGPPQEQQRTNETGSLTVHSYRNYPVTNCDPSFYANNQAAQPHPTAVSHSSPGFYSLENAPEYPQPVVGAHHSSPGFFSRSFVPERHHPATQAYHTTVRRPLNASYPSDHTTQPPTQGYQTAIQPLVAVRQSDPTSHPAVRADHLATRPQFAHPLSNQTSSNAYKVTAQSAQENHIDPMLRQTYVAEHARKEALEREGKP